MDLEIASSTEQPAPLWTVSAALQLLLQLGAILLALFLFTAQAWLPSRREQEVIDALAGRTAAAPALRADDYVEWTHSRCMGECPSYRVRLDRQGRVEFDGGFGTCRPGLQQRQITVKQAQAVLIAAELALRNSVTEPGSMDAPVVNMASRVAGRRRQVALTLGSYGSQFHLPRFVSGAGSIMLDPDWLPEWRATGLTCKGLHGERLPFDSYTESSSP